MKLSDLIAYRNILRETSATAIGNNADSDIEKISHLVATNAVQLPDFLENIKKQQLTVQKNFEDFEIILDNLRLQIDAEISQRESACLAESYRLYEEEMCNETAEYILKRNSPMSPESRIALQTRLLNYTDWQHAGMIIRPALESFVFDMVSLDPLYVVDEKYELLEPLILKFPEQYQRRLRPYVINERSSEPMLSKIPDSQFGLCLIYNLFNFRPLEIIKQYLTEIYPKLKPGGVLIMTFNDCDREKAVMLVESSFACYTPGELVKNLAQSLNYEILYSWHDNGPSTWLELRKPGTLTTLKGGQSFAKVVAYPT
jgi:hypothetical protein